MSANQDTIDWEAEFDLSDFRPEPEPMPVAVLDISQEADSADLPGGSDSISFMTSGEAETNDKSSSVKTQIPTGSGTLYFDIETIPDYDRQYLFGLPPLPECKPEISGEHLMDPEEFLSQTLGEIDQWFAKNNPCEAWLATIEQAERDTSGKKGNRKGLFDAIAKARAAKTAVEDASRNQRKKMSVTPEMCKIVAIGMAIDATPVLTMVDGIDGATERSIIESFWSAAAKAESICGFNVLGFDLPAIFMRSILLGIPASRQIDVSRYSKSVVDLYVRRFGGGFSSEPADVKTSKGLKSLCRQLGIEIPCDGVDGSQVEQIFGENPHLLKQYVASDVIVSRKLHRLYTGFFC